MRCCDRARIGAGFQESASASEAAGVEGAKQLLCRRGARGAESFGVGEFGSVRACQRPFDVCAVHDSATREGRSVGDDLMLHPPELRIRGNSHLIMQDKNDLQIADLILAGLRERVKN